MAHARTQPLAFASVARFAGRLKRRLGARGRAFAGGSRGSVSVELVITLPLLMWALAASVVFYQGYQARYHAQMAAQTVADIMSRETELFTENYIEGLNDVFDFLADSRYPTRLRVSSVIWDSANQRNRLQWSYGTRGLAPLPENTFELLQAGDYDALLAEFGEDPSFSFTGAAAQMPVTDLADRIPPVLSGEALLMVEAIALWEPFADVGLGQIRFSPVVIGRPRFAPWINFEGVDPIYPETGYEIAWTGSGNDSLPDPTDPPDTPDDPTPIVTSPSAYSFDDGETTGWSNFNVGSGAPSGVFLGPFGSETYATPVTLSVALAHAVDTVTIAFDLLIIDKWKGFATNNDALPRGDALTFLIDGTPISLQGFVTDAKDNWGLGRASFVYVNGSSYQVNMVPTLTGTNFMGRGDKDQIWRVTITGTHVPASFTLGFSAGLNNDVDRESFGIDNLTIAASGDGSASTVAYTPDAANRIGTDSFTRYPTYSGCPDHRNPAPWLTTRRSYLGKTVTLSRVATGTTPVRSCSEIAGVGYLNASPALVINYDNEGVSDTRHGMLLTMDDDDDGETCDTTLAVRDPNGQWYFNDDYDHWNAGLRITNPTSGQWTVFIGTYSRGSCTSQLTVDDF